MGRAGCAVQTAGGRFLSLSDRIDIEDVVSDDTRKRQERLALAVQKLQHREEKAAYEEDLVAFVKGAWGAIDSSQFQDSWALEALCDHLTAVTRGHIKRLLINFPPRCGKSNVSSIAWPAWVWAQSQTSFVAGPNVRFLCGSYNHTLSLQHSNSCRRVLLSPFYQKYWGNSFSLMSDQNAKSQYDTDKGGRRIATSVGGSLIGIGGDVILVDDPHNTESVESEADRETVLRWWKELSSTRLNDPKQSAIVVIMQRLHEQDVAGAILESARDWTHLMLPMRYVPNRHCVTMLSQDPPIQWEDPRIDTGEELLWPERYGEKEVRGLETELGPYMASGRLQQRPTPAGGGILKDEWWGHYILPLGKPFPFKFETIVASLDPAFTAKQENDPSGFTIWGVRYDGGLTRIMALQAWNKWLELHGQEVEREPGEPMGAWIHRAKPHWGLVEWVAYECRRNNVETLLIENKASGQSVAQEFRRLYSEEKWQVRLMDPGSQDKRARAYAVQHLFADGMIEAPASVDDEGNILFRDWAQMLITEASQFRGIGGEEDNLVDSLTQALKFLRDRGYAVRKDEQKASDTAAKLRAASGAKRGAIYPV